jgi:hypothetical protein
MERDAKKRKLQVDQIASNTAKINYERQEELLKKGLSSRKDFEDAKIEYKKLLSNVESIASEVAESETKLSRQENQIIIAPKDGVILRVLPGNNATVVKAGDKIATFAPTLNDPVVELYVDSNVAGSVINNTATFNTWRHIIWRRQNGYWDIYVSGTTTTPLYNASNLSNSFNWVIGGNHGLTELNNCRIALFKLYQRALSNNEIQQSYLEFQNKFYPQLVKSGLTFLVDASNPESYPGSGTVWYDISGKNYNINLLNGPTYSGEYGGAIVFDGTNDYGITRSLTQLEMGNRSCTIGAWFRTTDSIGAIATKRGAGSGYQHYIYTGKLYADGYSTSTGVFSASAINNNTVKYGVVVFDYANSTIRLYINGVADNTASLSSGGDDTSAYFNIARSQQYTDHFAGTIYSVQVYNKALSATEILQNFNAGRGRFNL